MLATKIENENDNENEDKNEAEVKGAISLSHHWDLPIDRLQHWVDECQYRTRARGSMTASCSALKRGDTVEVKGTRQTKR